jgi:hypothetical protein
VRIVALVALLGACATGVEISGDDPDASPRVGVDASEPVLLPCAIGDCLTAQCLRDQIETCGECRTFRCETHAINVCQRRCLPPEP